MLSRSAIKLYDVLTEAHPCNEVTVLFKFHYHLNYLQYFGLVNSKNDGFSRNAEYSITSSNLFMM